MLRATLMPLALIAFVLGARPLSAADRVIDGVPLPGDARVAAVGETDPGERRQWAGVWVGAFGGTLKHVLLVEDFPAHGLARVVYAIGGNPWLGIRRAWSRHEATLSGRRLAIVEAGFSVTYDLNDLGGATATYTRGTIVSHASMTKIDLTTMAEPGAIIPWTRGRSEFLRTAPIEDGQPVRLEVVIFSPEGAGPFPIAVFNHGSTGNGTRTELFKETLFDVGLADFLNKRGWIVAFPQRRGRGKSDGLYDEGFAADRRHGYTCDFDVSLAGADRALEDIAAAIAALRLRPDVAPSRILIGGQSRGGILSVAYSGMHPGQIFGVINFVGGWMGTGCDTASRLNGTLFERGASFDRPTIWLYGHHDPFYEIEHSRTNFAAFQSAGGRGTFMEFDVPSGYGHAVLGAPALWEAPVAAYLNALDHDASQ
jgi:dienelactone hydrolase